jgi:hypothetical protein
MTEPDNIHDFCINDRRRATGRREMDGFCEAHHESETALKTYIEYAEHRDEEQNKYMDKLDRRVSSVEKKVDDLRTDMPQIVGESLGHLMKDKLTLGLKSFWKWFSRAILLGLAGGITWLVITIIQNSINI